MRKRVLGDTGIEVSVLGYGCTQLTNVPNRREAIRLLESAFSLGITHFDVARSYGFGRAEGIVAEFLRGKRQSVTVATKFGIQPPSGIVGNRWVIDAAKWLLGPFPNLLQRTKDRGSALGTSGIFTAANGVESLETSLRELRTDYVDIFFLHEATLDSASNLDLIEALEREVEKGKIRALGIASAFSKLRNSASLLPLELKVVQFDDDVLARNRHRFPGLANRAGIVHSVFKPFKMLMAAIQLWPELVRSHSAAMQLDLTDPQTLGSLLLQHAMSSGTDAALFSSSDPDRVAANVRSTTKNLGADDLAVFLAFVDQLSASANYAHQPLETA